MTPDELKAARKAMGYSLNELAWALELEGERAGEHIRKMENGSKPISGPIKIAVNCLLNHHEEDDA